MIEIVKSITDILVADKKLYKECGDVFTYLNELKINFSNTKYHNIAWQFSQVIEIVYSNKLMGKDIDLFDAIMSFSIKSNKSNDELRCLILANFETTIYVSNYKKGKENIEFEIFNKIIERINKYPCYLKNNKNNFSKEISHQEQAIFSKLVNAKFSNNSLYFLGLFLYMYEKTFNKYNTYHIAKSISINLYLTQAKFLFAPTLCISYPIYNNLIELNNLLNEIDNDQNKIKEFTKLVLDVIKQAAIVNRALVMETNKVNSSLKMIFKKFLNLGKLKENNFHKLLNTLCFDEKLFAFLLEINSIKDAKDIINDLEKSKKIVNISKDENKKIYMFKDFYKAIKKLDNNKKLSTSEIFILKENKS